MAIRRNAPVIKIQADEAVIAALGDDDPIYGRLSNRRARARNMTPTQRKKVLRDRARTKVTYDVPEDLRDQITVIADKISIPASQIATVLLIEGLRAVARGWLNIRQLDRKPSRSPRFEWVLTELPEMPKIELEEI